MTAHELGRLLLAGGDYAVLISTDVVGCAGLPLDKVFKNLRYGPVQTPPDDDVEITLPCVLLIPKHQRPNPVTSYGG